MFYKNQKKFIFFAKNVFCRFAIPKNTGYIVADETGVTSDPAIFAAGDIRTKALRQVVTAAADGANAVQSVERYLAEA